MQKKLLGLQLQLVLYMFSLFLPQGPPVLGTSIISMRSGACSGSEKLRTKYHHVSCETAECEERGCSDLQKNKPAPTNESGKIIDCEASDSILDSTPLTTLQTKT